MPTGLKVPVRVNKSGGAAIETNESEQEKKMLELAFGEGDDKNPFQDLGIRGRNLIFSVMGAGFQARALRESERILAKFSETVALKPDEPIVFNVENQDKGEIEMSFEYVDLFTNNVEQFRTPFAK